MRERGGGHGEKGIKKTTTTEEGKEINGKIKNSKRRNRKDEK